jgi:Spx/MgsR family transcriptional regulator
MSITLYGIPNCDTVKKARTWLTQRGLAHGFVDYKKVGADRTKLEAWCDALGWERVLNRAGTTFRKLPEAQRDGLTRDKAIALMQAQPSCIKRPLAEYEDGLLLGFKQAEWEAALG